MLLPLMAGSLPTESPRGRGAGVPYATGEGRAGTAKEVWKGGPTPLGKKGREGPAPPEMKGGRDTAAGEKG
jgi:hypothetical protein